MNPLEIWAFLPNGNDVIVGTPPTIGEIRMLPKDLVLADDPRTQPGWKLVTSYNAPYMV